MKKLDSFLNFEVKNIDRVTGGVFSGGTATCKLTKCEPCPDDPCHDCCEDDEEDTDTNMQ